jgi:hypothetical protein
MKAQFETAPMSRVNRVTYYISPTHVATFNRIVPGSGSVDERYRFMVIFWRRAQTETGSEEEPCLVITSEQCAGGAGPILAVYDDAGRIVLEDELDDWADLNRFERRAMSIASERLATNFAERPPRSERGA